MNLRKFEEYLFYIEHICWLLLKLHAAFSQSNFWLVKNLRTFHWFDKANYQLFLTQFRYSENNSLLAACNADCNCNTRYYKPICSVAEQRTFFSRCYAGCTTDAVSGVSISCVSIQNPIKHLGWSILCSLDVWYGSEYVSGITTQKPSFLLWGFFSKCEQIRSFCICHLIFWGNCTL